MRFQGHLYMHDSETGRTCRVEEYEEYLPELESVAGMRITDVCHLPRTVMKQEELPVRDVTVLLLDGRYYLFPMFGDATCDLVGYSTDTGEGIYVQIAPSGEPPEEMPF